MKRRTLETKAAEVIMQIISESGEMETEEIMDLIRPHYLFDPGVAKEQGIRRKANQLAARIRDEKGVRTTFACNVGGASKYVNVDSSNDPVALRGVEEQLNTKLLGLSYSFEKASKRRMEVEGQISMDLEQMAGNQETSTTGRT